MADNDNLKVPLGGLDEEAALRTILEGTANETGERFFAALVENLAKALKTHGAWVTEYLQERRRLRALAFWMDGQWIQNYEVDIAGTPCEQVIDTANLVHFPDNLLELYPNDPDITETGAVSYLGMPLKDVDGRILGHLAVIDRRPMPEEPKVLALFKIFAARATAEMQRLRAEKQVREREEKLRRLFDSAMDAVIEFDQNLNVTRMNPAAEQAFQCSAQQVIGEDFSRLLSEESRRRLRTLMFELGARTPGRQSLWMFGLVEEFILPYVVDHARPQLSGDDYRVRALLQFAGEEAKHIHLFKRFRQEFEDGFGSKCDFIGPAEDVSRFVLAHSPLGVAIAILHIEWITLRHYIESVRDNQNLDPQFKSLLKNHWLEESQHTKLDTLIVESVVQDATPKEIDRAFEEYAEIGMFLDNGIKQQVEFDVDSFVQATGRRLAKGEREEMTNAVLKGMRWTYLGTGMTHPNFLATVEEIKPEARNQIEEIAPAFC